MASRRSVLIGVGGLVAGGGAVLGTGAFTTVEAERTVTVETAGDANAFLAFSAAGNNNPYVNETDGTVEINLDGNSNASGLNQNAVTTFEELVQVANNGTQDVTDLSFSIDVTSSSNDSAHENAFSIFYDGGTVAADGTTNVLSSDLTAGNNLTFGIEIDLLNGSISEIDTNAEFTLTITAETANSN